MSVSSLNQFLPPTIKNETYNPLTPWSISSELFSRCNESGPSSAHRPYQKVIVLPSNPEWRFVWTAFSHDLPHRYIGSSIFLRSYFF